jgi:hypothetical protein
MSRFEERIIVALPNYYKSSEGTPAGGALAEKS